MKDEVSYDTECWKKHFLHRRSQITQGRVNAGKLGFVAARRDTAPTIPVVFTSKENRPPDWINVVLVLSADPLVSTLFFQGPKQSQGHSCQGDSLWHWGLCHCTPGPAPPKPSAVSRASRAHYSMSFHSWFSKAFRCLRMHRDKRNFKDTLSLVFPGVLSVSENLTQALTTSSIYAPSLSSGLKLTSSHQKQMLYPCISAFSIKWYLIIVCKSYLCILTAWIGLKIRGLLAAVSNISQ